MVPLWLLWLVLLSLTIYLAPVIRSMVQEGFEDLSQQSQQQKPTDKEYQAQVKLLNDMYEPYATAKRPVVELQENQEKEKDVPAAERILVNYQALSVRFPAFLGPAPRGYMDYDIGIAAALKAGARTFILDIDYTDSNGANGAKEPTLVVRDIQGKSQLKADQPVPPLRIFFQTLHDQAFSPSLPQSNDPLILVLYFHRRPGGPTSKTTLDYYSKVAQALAPFRKRILTNELEGGKFYRHQQEGKLLMNKITNYNGKALIFSNADTSGFKDAAYPALEDLDFLTNLRLHAPQTKLGVTEAATGSSFGSLLTLEDLLATPDDRKEQIKAETTQRWTLALPSNPLQSITPEQYQQLTALGVHALPTILFDPQQAFFFQPAMYKVYGWRYKPAALRYKKPPVVSPGEPNPSLNAHQGEIRAPRV
jgi:hypothetical protein